MLRSSIPGLRWRSVLAVVSCVIAAGTGAVGSAEAVDPAVLPVRPSVGFPKTIFVVKFRVPRTIHTYDEFYDEFWGPGGRDGCRGKFRRSGTPAPFYARRNRVLRWEYGPAGTQEYWGRRTWCPGRFYGRLSVFYLLRGRPGCRGEDAPDRCYRQQVIGTFTFRVRRPG